MLIRVFRAKKFSAVIICGSLHEVDAFVGDGDEMFAVEVANGFLIRLLAHLESVGNQFGRTLIPKTTMSTVLLQIIQQHIRELLRLSPTSRLHCHVNLSIGTHPVDISL